MVKTLKKIKGKGKSFEVKPQTEKGTKTIEKVKSFQCLQTLENIEKNVKKNQSEIETVYQTLYNKVQNGYKTIEEKHGQFEFDKFDILQETFCIIQKYVNQGMQFENLEHYTKKVFKNTLASYHRKFIKPQNTDKCFVEFNTDKLTVYDETSPDTNYLDQGTIDRRFFVKTIIKNLTKKNKSIDRKLFALYHCKENSQKDVGKKLDLINPSLSIKRLNYKIISICKRFKIDTLLDTAFCIPSWKHESLKGKWKQKHNEKPSMSRDTNLDSQTQNGLREEGKIDFYDFEIPLHEKEIIKIQKGKRNIKQNGLFSNTTNQTRLINLLNTNTINGLFKDTEKKHQALFNNKHGIKTKETKETETKKSQNLYYGTDLFNAFYSKKSIFDFSVTD